MEADHIKHCKDLIANGNLDAAFDVLEKAIIESDSNDYFNFFDVYLQISGRYQGFKQDKLLGILSRESETVELNSIRKIFIELLNELKNASKSISLQNNKNKLESYAIKNISRKRKEVNQDDFEYDFFISYATPDSHEVIPIYQELRGLGFKVFVSGESLKSRPGMLFMESIQESLSNSQHFILYSTRNSMKSKWVKQEYNTFFSLFHLQNENDRHFYILKGLSFELEQLPPFLQTIQTSNNIEEILCNVFQISEADIAQAKEKTQIENVTAVTPQDLQANSFTNISGNNLSELFSEAERYELQAQHKLAWKYYKKITKADPSNTVANEKLEILEEHFKKEKRKAQLFDAFLIAIIIIVTALIIIITAASNLN